MAVAIIGLCGSASSTSRLAAGERQRRTTETSGDGQVSLFEFYDSDASAIEWLSIEQDDSEGGLNLGDMEEKRKDEEAPGFSHVKGYVTSSGPILPLIVSRVLNRFSYHLLVDFAEAGIFGYKGSLVRLSFWNPHNWSSA